MGLRLCDEYILCFAGPLQKKIYRLFTFCLSFVFQLPAIIYMGHKTCRHHNIWCRLAGLSLPTGQCDKCCFPIYPFPWSGGLIRRAISYGTKRTSPDNRLISSRLQQECLGVCWQGTVLIFITHSFTTGFVYSPSDTFPAFTSGLQGKPYQSLLIRILGCNWQIIRKKKYGHLTG